MAFFNWELTDNWRLESSSHIKYEGEELSSQSKCSNDWLGLNVPSTVLAALVKNKIYENLYVGENLKTVPKEIFTVPWWYVKTFELSKEQAALFGELVFEGINYKANIWLNGTKIADSNLIDGAYRITTIEASQHLKEGENLLAVEVIPPEPGDFSTGFVDWNPKPPDGNMGIFRPVKLLLHGGVLLSKPFVKTYLNNFERSTAEVHISVEVENKSDTSITGDLCAAFGDIRIEKKLHLEAHSSTIIHLKPTEFDQLNIKNPNLWWPADMGEPHLYELQMQFSSNKNMQSVCQTNFGIRSVADYWLDGKHRGFKINGKKLLIKGAGWTDDLLLTDSHEKLEAQIKYVRHMNLNCVRLEGFWGTDQKLYDLCDSYGILIMAGWSCHWEHEIHMGVPVDERFGGVYKPEHIEHVANAWKNQITWLRNHPSIFVWTVASDKVPITSLEEQYIKIFDQYDNTRPYLNSTGGVGSDQHVIGSEDVISEISGSSGVKMLGPYDYTAPVYWYTDTDFGGAYGFNTETGPGAQIPELSSIKKFIPEDKLWPINEVWNYHCGLYEFAHLDRFKEALIAKYGEAQNIDDFNRKAQALNYELMRPMFEAFRVNKTISTGVIHWMLNAAWPKMYWQLYDYYLMPTASFYAVKKACAPLQLIYNYGDQTVYLVNDQLEESSNLIGELKVFNVDSKLVYSNRQNITAEPNSSIPLWQLENLKNLSTTFFVDLRLIGTGEIPVSTNFYLLSTQEEILDYETNLGEFAFHTPSKQFSDFTMLQQLETIELQVNYEIKSNQIKVALTNSNNAIAFQISLFLLDEKGNDILPIFWDDNYLSLLPNEKRAIKVHFNYQGNVQLKISGWNIKEFRTEISPKSIPI